MCNSLTYFVDCLFHAVARAFLSFSPKIGSANIHTNTLPFAEYQEAAATTTTTIKKNELDSIQF